jgi:hypothetical protein
MPNYHRIWTLQSRTYHFPAAAACCCLLLAACFIVMDIDGIWELPWNEESEHLWIPPEVLGAMADDM